MNGSDNNCDLKIDSNNIELRQLAIDQTFGLDDKNNFNLKNIEIEPYSSTMSTSASMNSSMTSSGSSMTTEQKAATPTVQAGDEKVTKNNHQYKKYTSRIKKTLTYDVIKDNCDDNYANSNQNDDASVCTTAKYSINTNLLLGNTDDLINKINEKKMNGDKSSDDVDALSTRVIVNGSQVREIFYFLK